MFSTNNEENWLSNKIIVFSKPIGELRMQISINFIYVYISML